MPGGDTLSIELDLAAWRPTISGLQSEATYCLVCGSSRVSVRAGYHDAGWPAKKPLYCARPEGSYQSEELILEIVEEQQSGNRSTELEVPP